MAIKYFVGLLIYESTILIQVGALFYLEYLFLEYISLFIFCTSVVFRHWFAAWCTPEVVLTAQTELLQSSWLSRMTTPHPDVKLPRIQDSSWLWWQFLLCAVQLPQQRLNFGFLSQVLSKELFMNSKQLHGFACKTTGPGDCVRMKAVHQEHRVEFLQLK